MPSMLVRKAGMLVPVPVPVPVPVTVTVPVSASLQHG